MVTIRQNSETNAPIDPARIAFEILVREHHRSLLAFASALLAGAGRPGDRAAAEDLVQDALVIAFERLGDFDPRRDFAAWVRGIVRNRFLKGARNREFTIGDGVLAALEGRFAAWASPAPGVDGEDGDRDLLPALRDCLGRLGDRQRDTVQRFYLDGASIAQVALDLGASEAAIKKRLQRGRQDLADCLDRRMEVES
jgi:RNA polymerase sigma-70 factor (ECF subfamily)